MDALTALNPTLKPIIEEVNKVKEAMELFRKEVRREPAVIILSPFHWMAGADRWCGLSVVVDKNLPKGFKLS